MGKIKYLFEGQRIDNKKLIRGSLLEDGAGNCYIIENTSIVNHFYSSDVRVYNVYAKTVKRIL
jgi:hypothetical protein